MKKLSVKVKITIWITLLAAFLAGILLLIMLSVNSSVVSQAAMDKISQVVRSNLNLVNIEDGKVLIDEDFSFYQNGISTLIYSRNESLLAGQVPVAFTADEPFQNGITRVVSSGVNEYIVIDFWRPIGWDNGVWIRGLMEVPDNIQNAYNLIRMELISLPAFILLAAFGGYFIVKRAFRPLSTITSTAEAISEGRDLSGRIGLPPGRDEFSRLAATFDRMFERLEKSFEFFWNRCGSIACYL